MKFFIIFFIGLFLVALTSDVFAQKRKITVIIFRHADKESPTEGDDSEPDISIEGQKRALRLVFKDKFGADISGSVNIYTGLSEALFEWKKKQLV